MYSPYTIRVIARAIITKVDSGQGTAEELVLGYPESERASILTEVYRQRPDLQPAS